MSVLTQFYGGGGGGVGDSPNGGGNIFTMSNPRDATNYPYEAVSYSMLTDLNRSNATTDYNSGAYQDIVFSQMASLGGSVVFRDWRSIKNMFASPRDNDSPTGFEYMSTNKYLEEIEGLFVDCSFLNEGGGGNVSIAARSQNNLTSVKNFGLAFPFTNNGGLYGFQVTMDNCGLDQDSVDHILNSVAGAYTSSGITLSGGRLKEIKLNGGTSASPSAASSAAVTTLTNAGFTVVTN